ncbi:MAG TPA: D-alanine--D-alanine ligase [Alphaproteobacteria bacterium]|jgi:D-alanine-D-alanine ligase|nr:D-alanine--D-alanine ligase [Alphaproteobacteria bacterium]HRK96917.1 D-alanine--D-alanine ligase [Alphaproteobacteria bacterium]
MITVGFTYDLRDDYIMQGFSEEDAAEFDSKETIDSIEEALQANGYVVERIGNVKALVGALATGKRWDIVFNICEGVKGIGREAQVPSLLEAYDMPFVFSSPEMLIITTDKALAKGVLRDCGIATPAWQVIEDDKNLSVKGLEFPLFMKPVAEGSSKGISEHSVVKDEDAFKKSASYFLNKYNQPVLVETYLTGREFTVGILGSGDASRVIAVMEVSLEGQPDSFGRSFLNKDVDWTMPEIYCLPDDPVAQKAGVLALAAWRGLKGRDVGRVDVRCDEQGNPWILEINALPGLNRKKSDLPILAAKSGIDHTTLIGKIMGEAKKRYGL